VHTIPLHHKGIAFFKQIILKLINMRKKILLIIGLCLFFLCQAFAQTRTVTGTVTSKDDGTPIPGVAVKVKGTQSGTLTNSSGKYTISAPNGAVLEFSFIGYLTMHVTVQSDVVNTSLATATTSLNEIVVTANDIKREKRTLGYSAPTVDNKQLTEGGNPSALTSLTGLVAGANITSTSNTPGGSTRIVLRGGSSITGDK
jgi:hypothetical protein